MSLRASLRAGFTLVEPPAVSEPERKAFTLVELPAVSGPKRSAFTLVELPAVSEPERKAFTLVELPAVSEPKRSAFTLVELLVVIGIIAVLLAILLPSLARAREQARAAACLSNVRQLAAALNMYANDHQIFIFYGGPGFDRKTLLYPYLRMGKSNADNTAMSVWNCPANPQIESRASYGFNTKLNRVKYATIRRPSEKVAPADAGIKDNGLPDLATHLWSPGTPGTASSCRPDHLRHPKQTVMTGFVDGHAEPMTLTPPFYPGPVGHPQIGNGVTDPADPNFLDRMWVAQ